MLHGLEAVMSGLTLYGLTWMLQSSVLLAFGLVLGRLLSRLGPAVQSGVYRTTLAAVLICPVASAVLATAGLDRLNLPIPTPAPQVATRPVTDVTPSPGAFPLEPAGSASGCSHGGHGSDLTFPGTGSGGSSGLGR